MADEELDAETKRILALSNEEVVAEIKADGQCPAAIAISTRLLIDKALKEHETKKQIRNLLKI